MGNIHTVGPNEALIVSGEPFGSQINDEWRKISENAYTCIIYCHENANANTRASL